MTREAVSHDIYVSYAREDLSRVDPLVKAVELEGYSVWWDQTELRPGDTWQDKIEQAIATARCVVVFWTQAAVDSQEVRAEITFAQTYDKRSVLILTEPTLPAPALASSHTATFSGWDGRPDHTAIQSVIRLIAELAGPPPENSSLDQTEPPPRRTRRLRIPAIAWVKIPAGPFVYQEGEIRELPTFWIARYPVTNAQYQTFIDDGGYGEPSWWSGLERPAPESPHWPHPNRPRTNVNWYEAVAFTRWLNARLSLAEGSIRLPTELEWEKAARGTEGRTYPWGDEYRSGFANVDETDAEPKALWYLEQTTAAGLYPHGRSPYDVEDLAGTVWEWCLNKADDLRAVEPDTSAASRAVRGGSWLDDPDDARADGRNDLHPVGRDVYGGFRLLSSVPIEPVR